MKKLFFALTMTVTAMTATAQVQILSPAVEDTWIHGLGSSETSGSATQLGICPVAPYWIFLKFDLSAIGTLPEGSRFELRMNRNSGGRPEEIWAYLMTDGWSEVTLSGTNRPDPQMPATVEGLANGFGRSDHDAWGSPAFTSAIQQEIAGDGIVTLMVRENPADMLDIRFYRSRDGNPAETVPRIVIRSGGTSLGDFDGSGCTDLNDFLFLIDYWQAPYFGEPLGIDEFLSLVDNWQSGETC